MSKFILKILIVVLATAASTARAEIKMVKYPGFTLWVDCDLNSAVMFSMLLTEDVTDVKRTNDFRLDDRFDQSCQQTSTKGYFSREAKGIYHRGHLVSANAQDTSLVSMSDTFLMTNIVPQTKENNTGPWLETEKLEQCWRDKENIMVIGGVLFSNKRNDYFLNTHNVPTPDFFWKVIIGRKSSAAFLIPNTHKVTTDLGKYVLPVSKLEKKIGMELPVRTGKKQAASEEAIARGNCNYS